MIRWGLGTKLLLVALLAMRTSSLVVGRTYKQTLAQGGSSVVKAISIAQLSLCLVEERRKGLFYKGAAKHNQHV